MEYRQGFYNPKNPKKYIGNIKNIVFRSGLELKMMNYLDSHQDVLAWNSEEIAIPYISPVDNRKHRYFVDFFVRTKNKDGLIENKLIEIKPSSQCKPPRNSKNKKRLLNEVATWGVNQAKWDAATRFCESKGWKFQIITEIDLGMYQKGKK